MPRKPMDPFVRKMVYGSFLYGGMLLIMFAVLTVVYLHTRPRCSDRVVAEATDAGRHWTAAVMERRCGEDAPFFTHINLRRAGADLQRGFFSGSSAEGEVFLVEQDAIAAGITLSWTAPDTLRIQCSGCVASLLRKHDQRWNGVTLQYAPPTR
jgi:hypothetical protein